MRGVEGPMGLTGPSGPEGEIGPEGPKGEQGEQGEPVQIFFFFTYIETRGTKCCSLVTLRQWNNFVIKHTFQGINLNSKFN